MTLPENRQRFGDVLVRISGSGSAVQLIPVGSGAQGPYVKLVTATSLSMPYSYVDRNDTFWIGVRIAAFDVKEIVTDGVQQRSHSLRDIRQVVNMCQCACKLRLVKRGGNRPLNISNDLNTVSFLKVPYVQRGRGIPTTCSLKGKRRRDTTTQMCWPIQIWHANRSGPIGGAKRNIVSSLISSKYFSITLRSSSNDVPTTVWGLFRRPVWCVPIIWTKSVD